MAVEKGRIRAALRRASRSSDGVCGRTCPPIETRPPELTASVVVCTRDRVDLAKCLVGLQRLASQGHEVIVDSCPSDERTAHRCRRIRRFSTPRAASGAGIARNVGLRSRP
jgi:hypothetical protein